MLAVYGGFLILNPGHYGWLDSLDLAIHEVGHPLFGLFGEFIGVLGGTLTYTSVTAPPVPIRARDVSDSAVVSELGPYHSIAANADVVTTTTGKLRGDSLNGIFEMRPAGGGTVIMSGNFRSKRVVP